MKPYVASLELSQELKSLGMKQEGAWWWVPRIDPKDESVTWFLQRKGGPAFGMPYTAPTVGELFEILPEDGLVRKDIHGYYNASYRTTVLITEQSLCDALAKMIIYGCKHNLWKFKEGKLEVNNGER